jgi:hypothetical protein
MRCDLSIKVNQHRVHNESALVVPISELHTTVRKGSQVCAISKLLEIRIQLNSVL